MSIVTLKSVLQHSMKHGYAVGSFNFFGLENVQGIIAAAAEKQSPVIVQASPGCIKHIGEKCLCGMVQGISDDYGIPVVLHLDHASDFETIRRCIDNGFSSIMIDASNKSYQENVEITSRVVEYASRVGASVEAELGHVGGNEENISVDEREVLFTDPGMVKKYVKDTKIDALAVAVGTIHGFYKIPPKIDFERIYKINSLIPDMPLVLHGGTGISDSDFRRAIESGVRKINVGTELWHCGYGNIMKKYAEEMPVNGDPRKVMKHVFEECKMIVKNKIDVFGSAERLIKY